MDSKITYGYWDVELKNQSKERMKRLDRAITQTGSIIADRDECVIFTEDKLKWRNPLLLKIKVPKGRRHEFMLVAKVWLAEPPQVAPLYDHTNPDGLPRIPLRGNHDNAPRRRNYRIHPQESAYIADYRPELNGEYEVFEGIDIVAAVLDGDLDLLRRSSQQ